MQTPDRLSTLKMLSFFLVQSIVLKRYEPFFREPQWRKYQPWAPVRPQSKLAGALGGGGSVGWTSANLAINTIQEEILGVTVYYSCY